MYESATPRKKSQELIELERLVNADLIHRFRGEDPRFTSGKRFSDNTDNGLISCILAYIYLLGGTGERTREFYGITAQFRGYSLLIRVAVGQPGKAVFTEHREIVELTVHSFGEFKHLIDEM